MNPQASRLQTFEHFITKGAVNVVVGQVLFSVVVAKDDPERKKTVPVMQMMENFKTGK